jgi:hypothetical protein
MPVDTDRIFRVRISLRPWPRVVSRSASGTNRQGRPANCLANANLALADLLGADAHLLIEQIAETPG